MAKAKRPRSSRKSNDSSERLSSNETADVFSVTLDIVEGQLVALCSKRITLSLGPTPPHTQIHAWSPVYVGRVTTGNQSAATDAKPNTTPLSKPSFQRNGLHFGSVVKWIAGVLRGKEPTTGSLPSWLSNKS